MKIERNINGVKFFFELLPDELLDAFYEQRDKFDIEDIISYGEEMTAAELQSTYGCTYKEFLEHKEEMAERMRRNMDKYDMDFATAREWAINDVMKKVAV